MRAHMCFCLGLAFHVNVSSQSSPFVELALFLRAKALTHQHNKQRTRSRRHRAPRACVGLTRRQLERLILWCRLCLSAHRKSSMSGNGYLEKQLLQVTPLSGEGRSEWGGRSVHRGKFPDASCLGSHWLLLYSGRV